MQISKRLAAVADMVTPGCRLADIGTDHAYIPIYLAQAGKVSRAIAMDVNKGPLERAREHIKGYGLADVIETRLSDGLFALQPGEADQIVIAGMGGPLTVRILQDGAGKLTKDCALILQPQSEIQSVRAYLDENGYCIVREEMLCEDGKYYPMMKAVCREMIEGARGWYLEAEQAETDENAVKEILRSGENEKQTRNDENAVKEGLRSDENEKRAVIDENVANGNGTAYEKKWYDAQLRYGPLLIGRRHPVLQEYLLREKALNEKILVSLAGQESEAATARRNAVEYEQELIGLVLGCYR